MKYLPRLAVLSLAFFSGLSTLTAQETATDEKTKLIGELIVVLQMDKQLPTVIDAMLAESDKTYTSTFHAIVDGDKSLTDSAKAAMKADSDKRRNAFNLKFRKRIQERIDYPEFIREIMYPMYSQFFTEKELRDLVTFYRSETGIKFSEMLPSLMSESLRLSNEKLVPKLIPVVQELMDEEFGSMKASPGPPPPAPKRKKT